MILKETPKSKEIKMKLQQKLLLFLIIVLAINFGKSQNLNIGGTGNLGLSKVTSNLPISGDYKVKLALSGNLGMFIEKKISKKSILGMEVLWIQIEGKTVTKNKELTGFNGQELEVVGVISDKSTIHSSYIGVPFYYRLELGRVGSKRRTPNNDFSFCKRKL